MRVVVQRRRGAVRRIQEPVQAAAAVLECHPLLLLPENFDAHRLKHPRVHQGLTQPDGLVAGHRLFTEETVQGQMRQNHVHSLGAQEAVVVGLEVVAATLDLHVGLEIGDDAAPDEGGSERLPSHSWFWWGRKRGVRTTLGLDYCQKPVDGCVEVLSAFTTHTHTLAPEPLEVGVNTLHL